MRNDRVLIPFLHVAHDAVVLRCSLIKFYTVPPRCVFFLKSMINNPEFRQFIFTSPKWSDLFL